MHLLTLVRHAKSSWDHPTIDDFERPLNERGQRDAPRMAERVKRALGVPDRLVSSPAVRAITTARVFAETFGLAPTEVDEQARIYEASAESLLDIVRLFDNRHRHVMLFGHNPGLTELAHLLARCSFDDLPTCAAVQVGFDVALWSDVDEGGGTQRFYAFPKQLRQKT